jgi:hypothetical protein
MISYTVATKLPVLVPYDLQNLASGAQLSDHTVEIKSNEHHEDMAVCLKIHEAKAIGQLDRN